MPFFIALHDGEENLRSVWLITSEDARPEVAGVDEVQEIQANLAVDFEEDGITHNGGFVGMPPIVLADGILRQQNWLDRLAYTARGANWLTSYITGPYETDLHSPQKVLSALRDGSLKPDPDNDVVHPLRLGGRAALGAQGSFSDDAAEAIQVQ